jgi:hypothetical protein
MKFVDIEAGQEIVGDPHVVNEREIVEIRWT